ncbi:MAG: hypothetical protein ILO68_07165 [Clostridia bacterium]|nr:hypothetical protein [Clostridia bacterium]
MSEKEVVLMYRGKPLIRQGQFLFYGNPDDEYILFLNITETKKVGDMDVATKVLVQVQSTDDEKPLAERVWKQTEKKSLFDAFDIGVIWLGRALKSES